MTYDRYDDRRTTSRYGRDARPTGYDRDDRGFFDRARDEVASWFGDERAEHRRDLDERYDDRFERSPRDRSFMSDRSYGQPRDRQVFGYGNRDERFGRDDNMGRRPYTGRPESRSFGDDYSYDRAYSNDRWDRGLTQRELTGSAGGLHDRDYSSWRNRQIDDLDRDYDEFRRENSQRFESEFSSWREGRQTKRKLLSEAREHMPVVGSDMEPVGKVDHIKRDGVILTKSDSPDGRHHFVGCSMIDRIENDQIVLDKTASDALSVLTKEDESKALFERRERDEGPHLLNRSFSGTY